MYKAIIFFTLTFASAAFAAEPQPRQGKKNMNQTMNQTMVQLGALTQEIIPLAFDATQYAKPESKIILKKDLADLLFIFKNSPEHFSKGSVGFKASYNVMLDHLEQTQKVLEAKNYPKAREMIKAVPSICASCHTQDAQNQKLFVGLGRSRFSSDFDFAEFSYITRDYQSAITYYDKYITTKGAYKSKENTQLALERLLTIYAQLDREPALAATYMHEYLSYVADYPEIKTLLQQWILGLEKINDYFHDDLRTHNPVPFASIQNYVASFLFSNTEQNKIPEADKVKFIVLRGLLFNYLNEGAPLEKEKPMLLYWLALCDKKLNYDFYNSYSDIFLKECFVKYPEHPYGKLCKKEYEHTRQTAMLDPQ